MKKNVGFTYGQLEQMKELAQQSIATTSSQNIAKPLVIRRFLEDNLIAEFGSAREASRLTNINYGTISNVLIGNGKTAGGFIWKYKN